MSPLSLSLHSRTPKWLVRISDYVIGTDLLPQPCRIGEVPEQLHADIIEQLPLDHIVCAPRELGLTVQQFRVALEQLRRTEPEVVELFQPTCTRGPKATELLQCLELARARPVETARTLQDHAIRALLARWNLPMRTASADPHAELCRRLMDPKLFVAAAAIKNPNSALLQALIHVAPHIKNPDRSHGVAALRQQFAACVVLGAFAKKLDDRLRPFAGIHRERIDENKNMALGYISKLRNRSQRERELEFGALMEIIDGDPYLLKSLVSTIAYEAGGDKTPLLRAVRIAAKGNPSILKECATFLGNVHDPDELVAEWKAIFSGSNKNEKVLTHLASATHWIKSRDEAITAFQALCQLAPGRKSLQSALAWTVSCMPDPEQRYDELMKMSDDSNAFSLSMMASFGATSAIRM